MLRWDSTTWRWAEHVAVTSVLLAQQWRKVTGTRNPAKDPTQEPSLGLVLILIATAVAVFGQCVKTIQTERRCHTCKGFVTFCACVWTLKLVRRDPPEVLARCLESRYIQSHDVQTHLPSTTSNTIFIREHELKLNAGISDPATAKWPLIGQEVCFFYLHSFQILWMSSQWAFEWYDLIKSENTKCCVDESTVCIINHLLIYSSSNIWKILFTEAKWGG